MKKFKAVISLVTVAALMNLGSFAYAFRDAAPESRRAAEELSDAGMFSSFIYKFGNNYFRPEGNVSRDDMLLILREYYEIANRLFEQNQNILSRLGGLERAQRQQLTSSEIDTIIREVQRNLDPMLERSATIRNLSAGSGADTAAPGVSPDISNEVARLKEEVDSISREMKKLEAASPDPRSETDMSGLRRDVDRLKSAFSHLERSAVSSDETGEIKKEISEIKDSLDLIARALAEGSDIPPALYSRPSAIADSGLPFWTRLSIGFSALTLLFMSR